MGSKVNNYHTFSFLLFAYSFISSEGRFRGSYQVNAETGVVTGNPARAANISDLLHAIKTKDKSIGGLRNHAEAMSIQDLRVIMRYSERECPPDWTSLDLQVLETRQHLAKHLMMRAFLSTGFTVWTRQVTKDNSCYERYYRY